MRFALPWLVLLLHAPVAQAFPAALSPFKAEPLAHAPESLSSFEGKLLVVAFWASWCSVCHRAMPAYIQVAQEFKDKGVQFIAISVDETKEDALRHLETEQYPVPIYWDRQDLKSGLLLQGVPTVIVYKDDQQVMRLGGYDEKRAAKLSRMLARWTRAK